VTLEKGGGSFGAVLKSKKGPPIRKAERKPRKKGAQGEGRTSPGGNKNLLAGREKKKKDQPPRGDRGLNKKRGFAGGGGEKKKVSNRVKVQLDPVANGGPVQQVFRKKRSDRSVLGKRPQEWGGHNIKVFTKFFSGEGRRGTNKVGECQGGEHQLGCHCCSFQTGGGGKSGVRLGTIFGRPGGP